MNTKSAVIPTELLIGDDKESNEKRTIHLPKNDYLKHIKKVKQIRNANTQQI